MLKDARAALVTAPLSLAYSLSTSALIFGGPLQAYLGLGTAAALVTATITSFVTASASGFRIAIAGPTSTMAAALAVTVAVLDPVFARLSQDRIVPTAFAVLSLATMATGIALALVGHLRMGKVVRFLPYPVVAGFMGISGWLLAAGAVRLTTGVSPSFANLPRLAAPPERAAVLAMVAFAILLAAARRAVRNPAILPGLLIAAVVLTNIAVASMGPSAFPRDLMFSASAQAHIVQPIAPDMLAHVDWGAVASIVPNILAVILVTLLTALLSCSGLETDLDVDVDLDRELKVQGVGNALAALAGGYIGLISVGTTMASRAAGAASRLVGFVNAGVCLAALVGGIALVNDIPRFVVGGLQLQLGVSVLWTWCIASRKKMPPLEWLLVLSIVAVAMWFGFLSAVLYGIAGGCVLFAVAMSRVGIVRRAYALDERRSSVVRAEAELAAIAARGKQAQILELEGFIFFGSARQLLEVVRTAVEAEPGLILLDFTKVTGSDSSATTALHRLAAILRRRGARLVLVGHSATLRETLRKAGIVGDTTVVLPDLDAALQFAELEILKAADASVTSLPLAGWLSQALGSRELADRLMPLLRRHDLATGAYVCREGERTDSLLFIEHGRIGVMIGSGEAERRVRVLGAHTIAGEQGFILRSPRSASLKVEANATVWSLPAETFDDLARADADVAFALLCDIVRVQSERLSFASRETAALAR